VWNARLALSQAVVNEQQGEKIDIISLYSERGDLPS